MSGIKDVLDEATKGFIQCNPAAMALRSGAEYCACDQLIRIRYLNHFFQVSFPEGTIVPEDVNFPLMIDEQALILFYLSQASGAPLSNKWISFSELPSGMLHDLPFKIAVVQPLADYLGPQPEKLLDAARSLGGTATAIGDVGVIIPAFPHINIAIFLWLGDEEFPTKVNIVFDSVVPQYLTTAEVYALGAVISQHIMES